MSCRLDLRAIVAVAVVAVCSCAHGANVWGETSRSMCFALVAQRSGIPERLLRAVARVESNFRADAVHVNTDGTRDVGVMQINSSHFPDLETRFHITEQILLERPCVNIAVGARILGDFLQKYQGTWRGVGSYGAGMASNKEGARRGYANLVAHALAKTWHANQVEASAQLERRMVVIQ